MHDVPRARARAIESSSRVTCAAEHEVAISKHPAPSAQASSFSVPITVVSTTLRVPSTSASVTWVALVRSWVSCHSISRLAGLYPVTR
jgi:hypothetical protein